MAGNNSEAANLSARIANFSRSQFNPYNEPMPTKSSKSKRICGPSSLVRLFGALRRVSASVSPKPLNLFLPFGQYIPKEEGMVKVNLECQQHPRQHLPWNRYPVQVVLVDKPKVMAQTRTATQRDEKKIDISKEAFAVLKTKPLGASIEDHIRHVRNRLASQTEHQNNTNVLLPSPIPTAQEGHQVDIDTRSLGMSLHESRQRCVELELELATHRNASNQTGAKRRKVKSAADEVKASAAVKENTNRQAVEFLMVVAKFADSLQNPTDNGIPNQETIVDTCESVLKLLEDQLKTLVEKPVNQDIQTTGGNRSVDLINSMHAILKGVASTATSSILTSPNAKRIRDSQIKLLASVPHSLVVVHQVNAKPTLSLEAISTNHPQPPAAAAAPGNPTASTATTTTLELPSNLIQNGLSQILLDACAHHSDLVVCLIDSLRTEFDQIMVHSKVGKPVTIEEVWMHRIDMQTAWMVVELVTKILKKMKIAAMTVISLSFMQLAATQTIMQILSTYSAAGSGKAYTLNNVTLALRADSSAQALVSQGGSTFFAPVDSSYIPAVTGLGAVATSDYLHAALTYHTLLSTQYNPTLNETNPYSLLETALKAPSAFVNLPSGGQKILAIKGAPTKLKYGQPLQATILDTFVATDGVVNVIDSFMFPPALASVAAGTFGNSKFVSALNATGLTSTVNGLSGVTILVPQDVAFQVAASTLNGYSTAQTTTLLNNHIVKSIVYSTSIVSGQSLNTVGGGSLSFSGTSGLTVTANGVTANVVTSDIPIAGGVMHIIDTVLFTSSGSSNPSTGTNGTAKSDGSRISSATGLSLAGLVAVAALAL
ncbi:hypothetical protein SmJEL517_g00386 [Synchytrium microbalum]|uniref:FAS1 domain-containing protein n=1 Tax=Synchytrium microbalum TaxID=1806994 RepID=A0A507CK32_9FUNG|nr:uncharacterized protein SmJEL517_g00386 [Synchytrium microbalum]TPX38245.1 hypothetical protein SmJEL517_g00386 [Synchytrium microbalum]